MKARGWARGAHSRPRGATWNTCWGGGWEVCVSPPLWGPKETLYALLCSHKHTPLLVRAIAGAQTAGGGVGRKVGVVFII